MAVPRDLYPKLCSPPLAISGRVTYFQLSRGPGEAQFERLLFW